MGVNVLVIIIICYVVPDFLAAPPETVYIQGGAGANLYCVYGDPQRQVDWYIQDVVISGAVEGCSCRSQSNGFGTNLTFSNFRSNSAGEYGCWATISSGIFDKCTFYVTLAGKKTHSPNSLHSLVCNCMLLSGCKGKWLGNYFAPRKRSAG